MVAYRVPAALVACGLLSLTACSDDGSGGAAASTAASTPAAATAAPTTEATTTTVAATTSTAAATTSTTSTTEAPTTSVGPTAAELALEPFLDATDAVMNDAGQLWPIVDGARGTGAETLPDEGWPFADEINADFYGLSDQIPHGLEPEVTAEAMALVFDVGNHVAPFVFAPGFDFATWDPAWDHARSAGLDAYQSGREALLQIAHEHGEVREVDPKSLDAATDAVRDIVIVRSFGHNLVSAPPPFAVRWFSALPTSSTPDEVAFCQDVSFGEGTFGGDFVDGVGGCAMLYSDTTDPDAHDAELAAYLADPANAQPPGEVVTVLWDDDLGGFVAYGSAE